MESAYSILTYFYFSQCILVSYYLFIYYSYPIYYFKSPIFTLLLLWLSDFWLFYHYKIFALNNYCYSFFNKLYVYNSCIFAYNFLITNYYFKFDFFCNYFIDFYNFSLFIVTSLTILSRFAIFKSFAYIYCLISSICYYFLDIMLFS